MSEAARPGFQTFCTRVVPQRQRVGAWKDWINESVTAGLDIQSHDQTDFKAVLHRTRLGRLGFMYLASDAACINHRQEASLMGRGEPAFLVHLQRAGESVNYQDGRQAVLKSGDYILRDNTREYAIELKGDTENLVVRIPYARLRERISYPEGITCIAMPGDKGLSGVCSEFIRQLWDKSEGGFESSQERLGDILIDLLVESYRSLDQVHLVGSSSNYARRLQVLKFVEENLRNEKLSPAMIAESLNLSRRYLHRLFQNDTLSIGRLILNRRLERCARDLIEPLQDNQSITEIAFRWGFNSPSYFGRAFRDSFGVTPKEYRRRNSSGE